MAGLTSPTFVNRQAQQPKPVNPYTPTTTQTPSPGVTGSAPSPQQYPTMPGAYNPNPGGATPTGTKYDVDPTGKMTPYTPYSSGPGQTSWRAGDPTDLFQLGQDRFLAMLRALKAEGMGGPVGMGREPGLEKVGREAMSTMNDRTAAESAAFGRAKDRTAKLGKSAIDAMKDRMSSMGMAGSTNESQGVRDIIQGTQGQLGEVIRQQAEDRLDRADQLDDRNLSAGIQQRSQDIGQNATEFGGNIQQRGQDFQGAMNNPMQQMMMQLMSSFYGGGTMGMPRLF